MLSLVFSNDFHTSKNNRPYPLEIIVIVMKILSDNELETSFELLNSLILSIYQLRISEYPNQSSEMELLNDWSATSSGRRRSRQSLNLLTDNIVHHFIELYQCSRRNQRSIERSVRVCFHILYLVLHRPATYNHSMAV
jgi:hypothetical protein